MKLISHSIGGNIHEMVSLINKLNLAKFVLTIDGATPYATMDQKDLEELWRRMEIQSLSYNLCIIKTGYRKWYNPMRWIRGQRYQKILNPKDFYEGVQSDITRTG